MPPKHGRCRICGEEGALSAEHVLPKAAGNTGRIAVHTLQSLANGHARGELFQNGLIRRSLCPRCNSACGRHYVPAFARWTLQAAMYHERMSGESLVLLPFTIHALAVAKQLAVMAIAMCDEASIQLPHYCHLREFVTHPSRDGPLGPFRLYAYFHFGPPVLEGGFYASSTTGGPSPLVHCHVGREPLGYLVTAEDEASTTWARRQGLCDLSGWAHREPRTLAVEHLLLPCRKGELPFRPS